MLGVETECKWKRNASLDTPSREQLNYQFLNIPKCLNAKKATHFKRDKKLLDRNNENVLHLLFMLSIY